MQRHDFLAHLHRAVEPRNYLEIGVSNGRSLALATVPSIGIDPAPKVKQQLRADAQVVKATSDDFFARPDPLRHLRGVRRSAWDRLLRRNPVDGDREPTLDFAFIDGMHLLEYALRDFMNVERYATWTSVIVFDDVLPRDIDEASRDRHSKFWAGDVYKLIDVLHRYRPELVIVPVDTQPTGVLVVLGADPANRALTAGYDDIVRSAIVPDPQSPPETVLSRADAIAPDRFVKSAVWGHIVAARNLGTERDAGYARIRDEIMSLKA